jgi:hypothetical protein
VRDAISAVEDNTGGTTRGVQGQHGLDGHVHGGRVEGFEHDLRHLLPVHRDINISILAVWQIRDVYPGSDFFPSRIPDPNCLHPESRILKIF